jgi:hypothetical protein
VSTEDKPEKRKVHEPGECFDTAYGQNCDGLATFQEDPFAADVYDNHELVWLCEGEATGKAMDI